MAPTRYSIGKFDINGGSWIFADQVGGTTLDEMVEQLRSNYYLTDTVLLRPGDNVG